jgi:hypothetical protein
VWADRPANFGRNLQLRTPAYMLRHAVFVNNPSNFSRRGFLKTLALGAGAVAGTRLAGSAGWGGSALAAGGEKPALLVVFTLGGYNAIFSSAASLVGKFGVTAGNHTVLGGGLSVDNSYANTMSPFVKTHMAAIGVRHGISSHIAAWNATLSNGSRAYPLMLANAMGGNAALKAAFIGNNFPRGVPKPPEGAVSLQTITDMGPTINALGGGPPDPRAPDRNLTAAVLARSQEMSKARLASSPVSLTGLREGYAAAIDTVKQPSSAFSFDALATAYGLPANATAIANNNFKAKMAAAELMITAGANVVMTVEANPGWDTHGDTTGVKVRNQMNNYLLPPLNTFMDRMVNAAGRNVVVCIMGDFARSLPGSDHQPNLTATVIGKYVKQGSTGKVDAAVGLPAGTPSSPQLWSYLAAVTKTAGSPLGANPHALVLP